MQPASNLTITWPQPDYSLTTTWLQPAYRLTTTWLQPEYTTRLQPEYNQTTTWLYYVTWNICYILHLKPQFFVNLIIKTIKTCICKLKDLGKSFTKYFFSWNFKAFRICDYIHQIIFIWNTIFHMKTTKLLLTPKFLIFMRNFLLPKHMIIAYCMRKVLNQLFREISLYDLKLIY